MNVYHLLQPAEMHVEHHENFDLWNKSEEMVSFLGTFRLKAGNVDFAGQIEELIRTANHDITQARTQRDLYLVLYHFSKAKAACLTLKEILQCIDMSIFEQPNAFLFQHNEEIISMLNRYIHLTHVNITISTRQKINL